MRNYVLPALAALGLLALPAVTRAADAKPAGPTVVVRIEPFDDLLADVRHLATLADREELVKQFEGLIRAKAGAKGLDGIDLKRPLGFYGTVGTQGFDSSGVLMVPVADEKAFLTLLDNLNLKPEKGKDGLYTVQAENTLSPPVYFRFANGYAYATVLNQAVIDRSALLPPDQILPPGRGGLAVATVHVDRIPDNIKQLALGQVGLRLADLRDRSCKGETKAESEFWKQAFEELGRTVKELLRDGRDLSLRVDVDRTKQDLTVEVTADARPGSKLATAAGDLAGGTSRFAGLLSKDAALQGLVHLTLPEELRRALQPVVDESVARTLAKSENPERREQAERFFKALGPTLRSGDVDAVAVLRAPAGDGAHTLLLGYKVKDGESVDRAFHDVVKGLREGDRARIKLDADQAGSVKIHRIDAQKDYDEQGRRAFGDNPIYLAIGPDAAFLVFGADGVETIKKALAAPPQAAQPLQLDVSLGRLAPAIAINRKDTKGEVAKAAQDAFGRDRDADRVRLVVEGGKTLRLRFSMKTPVLKFISELDKAEQAEK
jgi:hypothetical protein